MVKGGELSEGELRFVNQIIGEEPVWVRWVKKTNRKDVVQDRLLAVGIYRIFSIKRTKTGKKQIQRGGHILGLKEIFSDDIDKVRLDFGDFKVVVTGTSLGMELPKVLLNCFHKITFTFPDYAIPKLVLLPHGRNPPPIDPLEPGIAGGLIETYFAQCDFLNIPPSGEVITYLEDACNTDERHINFDQIQGFSKNSEFSFNPTPLLAALRHNTYFTSLSCHDKSRKDIVPLIADVILHNKTLMTIDLTGLEAEDGWTQIGDALRGNPSHQIMDFILSENPINDKAAAALGSGLASPHGPGIRKFKMTNSKISAAGAGALIKGLSSKRDYNNFCEIDLSHNSLKGAAMSFSELVASMQSSQSRLQRIVLAHTQIDLAPLIDGIRHTLYGVVEYIDFTGCRMDEHAAKLSTYLFEKTTTIKHVLMGSCGLTGHQIAGMVSAISSNGKIADLSLDFSNNILDTKNECDIFCKSISEAKNLYALSLREMEFGKSGDECLTLIVKALSTNYCIREVDLSGNFKIKPKEKDNGLGPLQLLASVLEKHTSITSLKIEGIGQNVVGRSISTLFPLIGESSKLQKLNVRGHGFGDAGAKELFDTLRWNKSLLSLQFDNNLVTQAGWAFALRCLNANRTIQEIEYPKMDIARVVAKTSTFPTHESVFSIFSKIAKFTANNISGEFDERGPVPSKPSKEHAYQVRKASRMATMVISRVASGSIPPLPLSPSSPSSYSPSPSFDDGSDTDSNDSGSNLSSPNGRPPVPPRSVYSSSSLSPPSLSSSQSSPSTSYPPPPPLFLPPPPLNNDHLPSSPTLGNPPPLPLPIPSFSFGFSSPSLSLTSSSEPPLGTPPLPPPY